MTVSKIIRCCTVTIALLSLFAQVHAQLSAAEKRQLLEDVGNLGVRSYASFKTFDERYEGVRGSPFLFEEWQDGHIVFSNGKEIAYEHLFNIDATTSQLLILLPPENVISVTAQKIAHFELTVDGQQRRFVSTRAELFNFKAGDPQVLAEVLTCGDVELYVLEAKRFVKADYKGAYSPDRRYDEYIPETEVMARVGEEFREVKLKKKSIIKALGDVVPGIEKRITESKFEAAELCAWLGG